MNAVIVLDDAARARREAQPLLAAIAARATSLWERLALSEGAGRVDSELCSADALNRWTRWQYVSGGEAALLKRLEWDGLQASTARAALLPPHYSATDPLPSWVVCVDAIMRAARQTEPGQTDDLLRADAPVPFEHMLLPVVAVARKQLRARARPDDIGTDAMLSLERSLLLRLGQLCVATLHSEFVQDFPFGEALLNAIDAAPAQPNTDRYRAFVERHLRDGCVHLFLGYPVLARLVATVVEFWVEATAELLQRLAADASALDASFGAGSSLGPVVAAQWSLSDPHRRGRSVAVLTFSNGSQLVYKPKDVALERVFGELIDWCNQRSGLPALRTARVLERTGYGWVEFMPAAACLDEGEARLFHERAGALLAVLYMLRATDCHYENIVASGAHPVLVDMETLLHHEPKLIDDSALADEVEGAAAQTFLNSVLRTGLLPRWEASQDLGSAYDISGLGGAEGRAGSRRVAQWRGVNTDAMRLVTSEVPVQLGKNVAFLGDRPLSPHRYQQQIVDGFAGMYRFLAAHAERLLAAGSPLMALREQAVRFIFRHTRTYGSILEAATVPERLSDGADFSIELDHLARAFLVARHKPAAFPILRAEHEALQQLDVPLFSAAAGAEALTTGPLQPMGGYFRRSSFEDVRRQLLRMSEADLAMQVALINGAFDAKIATVASRFGGAWRPQPMQVPPRECFIEQAIRIGDQLAVRAIPSADGGVNWIGLDFIPHVERFQQIVLNNSLCDGRGGVALFLAALAKVSGELRFAALARAALSAVRKQIHALDGDLQAQVARLSGIGGATGIPSIVYSLVGVARFLDDARLLADAERMASWIGTECILADESFDIMSGAAGAVLALGALHEATGSEQALMIAHACGRHLLAKQGMDPAHPLAWKAMWPRPLTGYSHGAAGIAYALHRLFHLTGDINCRHGADRAIAYETALFDAAHGNWPDFRSGGDERRIFATRWCHGAPGIALARLGSKRYVDDRQLSVDIDHALTTTAACELTAIDHLCCGNFGRIEVLLVGGLQTGRQRWLDAAYLNAANVVARGREQQAYQLFPNLPTSVFNPGFLAGSAGIGYQLLRLAEPTLPSVLLWE